MRVAHAGRRYGGAASCCCRRYPRTHRSRFPPSPLNQAFARGSGVRLAAARAGAFPKHTKAPHPVCPTVPLSQPGGACQTRSSPCSPSEEEPARPPLRPQPAPASEPLPLPTRCGACARPARVPAQPRPLRRSVPPAQGHGHARGHLVPQPPGRRRERRRARHGPKAPTGAAPSAADRRRRRRKRRPRCGPAAGPCGALFVELARLVAVRVSPQPVRVPGQALRRAISGCEAERIGR